MDERDLIDELIDELNDGVPEATFDRDALETDRPESWGAVELTGEDASEWADGIMVDQVLAIDVWVCLGTRGSGIKRRVERVLNRWAEERDAGWRLVSRSYIYDLDKVVWRWRVNLFAPLAEEDPGETAEEGGA